MALTKPPVLPPWAESGDMVQPSNSDIQTGWPLSNVPPSRQRFNWLLNFLMNGVRWLTRRGLPDWAADENYEIGDRVQGPDGLTYVALTQNTNKTPASNPSDWEQWGLTISQLDARLSARDFKESCRVATTANLATLSGLLTIDGVTLVAGDRVLVKSQSTGSQNGIYVAAAGAWARAEDANGAGDLTSGVLVPVEAGTTNADTIWMLTTDGAITIGTTALTWQIKSGDASTTRKGQVQLATSAEVADGTDEQKAVSPATLLSGLLGAGGNSGDDYITIPYRDKTTGVRRNLIIQRVGVLTNTSADAAFTFPIAFPTGILRTFASLNIGTGANYTVGAAGTSLSGGIAFSYVGSSGARIAANVNVFVIGH